MKALYLHIGTPKTGTSSIQRFLYHNRKQLKKHGFYFNTMPWKNNVASNYRNAHFLIEKSYDADGKRNQQREADKRAKGLRVVESWFDICDHVILSDEMLWDEIYRSSDQSLLQELSEFCSSVGAELKIIVYLRRQEDICSTWYRERIKTGYYIEDPEDFFRDETNFFGLDYSEILSKIEKTVPTQNIIVRKYDRSSFYHHDLTEDFLHELGLSDNIAFQPLESYVNTSLNYNMTYIKNILNRFLEGGFADPTRININRFFRNIALKCSEDFPESNDFSFLSVGEKEALIRKYEKSNQQVAEKYFPSDGSLFSSDRTQESIKWDCKNDKMTEDIVLFFGQLCLWLNEQMEEQRSEYEKRLLEQEKKTERLSEDLQSVRKLLGKLHRLKKKFKRKQE